MKFSIHRDKFRISFCIKNIMEKIIEEFEMKLKVIQKTLPGITLPFLNEVPDVMYIDKYKRLLGELPFLSLPLRFDICYAVNLQFRLITNHHKALWRLVKGSSRYMNGTKYQMNYFFNHFSTVLNSRVTVGSASAFYHDFSNKKSTKAHPVIMDGHEIWWNLSVTKCVGFRTTETEFIATVEGLRTKLYLEDQNQEILIQKSRLVLLEDNQSCITDLKNPTGNPKDKRYRYMLACPSKNVYQKFAWGTVRTNIKSNC